MVYDESGLENGVGIARKISNAFVEGAVENGRPVDETGGRAVVASKRGGQHFVRKTDELHAIVGGETVGCAAVGVVLLQCRGGVEFGCRGGEVSGHFW